MRHGGAGYLVPIGDVCALELKLRALLSDDALSTRMGARAYELAHTAFSEQVYIEEFTQMVKSTVRDLQSKPPSE
jgi:glycosyltransferase involved in cell wall biosynthesis